MDGFSWLRVAEGMGLGVVAVVLVVVPAPGVFWEIVGLATVCSLLWLLFATAD